MLYWVSGGRKWRSGISSLSCCRSRSSDFSDLGEIISIYLLPQYIGKGYGKPLLDAAVGGLEQSGFDDIFLWVLEDNLRARRFYEKAGFTPSGIYLDDTIGRKELKEIQYCCSVKKWK